MPISGRRLASNRKIVSDPIRSAGDSAALGEISQNHLGRLTAMDPSTIGLVVRKQLKQDLARRNASKTDQRLAIITLTAAGVRYTLDRPERSVEVGRQLLAPLSAAEQATAAATAPAHQPRRYRRHGCQRCRPCRAGG